jgi:hypothetical protein
MEEQEPNDLISKSLILDRLYDMTGFVRGGMSGFVLFYINEKGEPSAVSRADCAATLTALKFTIQQFYAQRIEPDLNPGQ